MANKVNIVLPISLGRTGSTLLMGLLNSFDGVLVRGENNLFCFELMKSVRCLEGSLVQKGKLSTDPWFGTEELDIDRFIENLRKSVVRELQGSRKGITNFKWIGFKEIRYADLSPDDLYDFVVFLDRLFPNVHFIHHTRDYSSLANSGWWMDFRPDLVIPKFRDFDLRIRDILDSLFPDRTFHSSYESILNNSDSYYRDLGNFLGVETKAGVAASVIGQVHSTVTSSIKKSSERTARPKEIA